jgi:hypothetical protein
LMVWVAAWVVRCMVVVVLVAAAVVVVVVLLLLLLLLHRHHKHRLACLALSVRCGPGCRCPVVC